MALHLFLFVLCAAALIKANGISSFIFHQSLQSRWPVICGNSLAVHDYRFHITDALLRSLPLISLFKNYYSVLRETLLSASCQSQSVHHSMVSLDIRYPSSQNRGERGEMLHLQ